ncbi:hypothetical protein TNCT_107431 [Trichonephila clavata]|uniref:Uncharacterized protein n=1 Tax=Trichonephila clavata TaxID=2740835 RepID=A0A8X6L0D0_TRICU|nr:hypothetical protein TNCT_107431 [Trichonephila clavata]
MQTRSTSAKFLCNQRFIKRIVPEINCARNLSSTIARLHTDRFKGMKISPDNSRSYLICRNCPQTQLTSDHILNCKALFASFFKLDESPRDILYRPQAPDQTSLVIGAFEPI